VLQILVFLNTEAFVVYKTHLKYEDADDAERYLRIHVQNVTLSVLEDIMKLI
jgi:hypothetical protein